MPELSVLKDISVLHIGGADAQEFLHAQLTSDVRALKEGQTQLTTYCSPQGRVLAVMTLVHTGDGFLALLPRDIIDQTLMRLRMFVLRAEVELAECPEFTVAAAWGTGLELALGEAGMALPGSGYCTQYGPMHIAAVPAPTNTAFIVGPASALGPARFGAGFEVQSAAAWRYRQVEAGFAEIHAATADRFLPQMLGLDELDAVSFRKGCYPGQEVIARARYRGKVKRHLVRGSSPVPLEPGAQLRVNGDEAAVVLFSAEGGSGWRFLAVGRDELIASGRLCAADGSALSLD